MVFFLNQWTNVALCGMWRDAIYVCSCRDLSIKVSPTLKNTPALWLNVNGSSCCIEEELTPEMETVNSCLPCLLREWIDWLKTNSLPVWCTAVCREEEKAVSSFSHPPLCVSLPCPLPFFSQQESKRVFDWLVSTLPALARQSRTTLIEVEQKERGAGG